MKKVIALLALFSIVVFAQNTFTDPRDGKKYKTVKISNQLWMAQNLDYHGEDGFFGLCYGDEPRKKIRKPENCEKNGRLYSWDEATKVCPEGWHLPDTTEWKTLEDFAGGEKVAGKKFKAKSGWEGSDGNGTDEYGFSALPGGNGYNGSFYNVGINGYWWSATEDEYKSSIAYSQSIFSNKNNVYRDQTNKSAFRSVRCTQGKELTKTESSDETLSFTDPRDGKKYKTVKIGTQTWMAKNLNFNTDGSKCYDNNPEKCEIGYGRLYNGDAALRICPKGWHLPNRNEWQILVDFAGGEKVAGRKLKAKRGWEGSDGNGTDEYGFSALPGGYGSTSGNFSYVGNFGYWWSAGKYDYYSISTYHQNISYNNELATWGDDGYIRLFSVRCVQD